MTGRNGVVDELGRRALTRQEILDLDTVLSTDAGRRLYYRLIHELGRLEGNLFPAAIKDGMAMALHDAYARGYQHIATCMAEEVREHLPDLWDQLIIEKLRSDRERRDRQREEQHQEDHHE